MAQFRGTLQGQAGEVSRIGSKSSGLWAEINGWTSGITVDASFDEEIGDYFEVYGTTGSKGGWTNKVRLIGIWRRSKFYAVPRRQNRDSVHNQKTAIFDKIKAGK